MRRCTVKGGVTCDHAVQLFDSDGSRADAVASLVREAFVRGEPVLLALRGATWRRVAVRLADLDSDAALAQGRLVLLDATDTLDAITRNRWPVPDAFDEVIGARLRALAATGRVTVYGELVDVLAAEGEYAAAEALEALWNGLADRVSFSLLCGYSSTHFGDPRHIDHLDAIVRSHSHLAWAEDDVLGGWLTSVHRRQAH